jgi:copper(I)-binding protein
MFTTLSRAAMIAAFTTLALPALAEGIEVHDAYVIQGMPGGPTAAAFMVIHNHGGAPDRLIGVRSEISELTELHTHVTDDNGVMQMVEVTDGLDLPTDGEILMQRGGHHVMFMGVTAPIEDGAVVPITLIFETAGEFVVEAIVDLDRMAGDAMDHGDMDHGSHGSD